MELTTKTIAALSLGRRLAMAGCTMTIEQWKTLACGIALVCGGCGVELAAYAAWHWFGG